MVLGKLVGELRYPFGCDSVTQFCWSLYAITPNGIAKLVPKLIKIVAYEIALTLCFQLSYGVLGNILVKLL